MFFCDHITKFKTHLKRQSLEKDLGYLVFDKAEDVMSGDWNEVLKDRNTFLSLDYLRILERNTGKNFQSRYVIVYKNESPYGIAYFQVIDFVAGVFGDLLDLQVNSLKSKRLNMFEKYINGNKDEVLMRLLTCGNNVVSGEHAFLFKENVSKEKEFKVIEDLIEKIGSKEKLRGKISAVLVKDFEVPLVKKQYFCPLKSDKYVEFRVEPNMVVDIPAEVKTLDDYIALFSKKYRHRAKGILKAMKGVEIRDLSSEEIKKENKAIYKLYEQVYNHAKFKLVKLPEHYFYECKNNFPEKFSLAGFYKDDKLIAFTSCFEVEGDVLEAHYIGFDYEMNKELELYQNILYYFIRKAIARGKRHVNLGRTASEIKSTVGAKVQELTCYIKPQNTVSKVILKPFIGFLQPAEWIPRNPFKEEVLSY